MCMVRAMSEQDERYQPLQIETRWQKAWEEADAFATTGEGETDYTYTDDNGAEFQLTGLRLGRQFHPRP